MFRALIFSAVAAGCVGGLLVSVFQWAVVTPLILEAEVFENGVTASHGSTGLDFSRTALTALASVVYASGLALVLLGLMTITGEKIQMRSCLAWGLAGFFAVGLAPALGLPPVVPGIPEAPLLDRQIWWFGTVLATGFGLWVMLRRTGPGWIVAGFAAIIAPHLIGAPHVALVATEVPAALAAHFVSASLVASLLLWICVSGVAGLAFERFGDAGE